MVEATPIELRKIAYRQSAKDGLVITFAVHPDDMPANLASAPIGSRFMAALVEIGDDEQPVERNKQHPIVQRAAILCGETLFQKFMEEEFPFDWQEANPFSDETGIAAALLRNACGITSRKELATDPLAVAKFDKLTAKFEMWKRGQ